MAPLTQHQLDFFSEHGYLVLEKVFTANEVASMQAESDYILELAINSSLAHKRLSRRLDWRLTSQGDHMVRKIQPINDLSLLFTQIAADQRLIDPLSQIMGEAPVLMEEKLNGKQPLPDKVEGLPIRRADDHFPIHNDWAYYRAQNYPQTILSSALLIDDSSSDNGPLRIWPGSHRSHLEHEETDNGWQVKPTCIDHQGGMDMIAPAGSFMIFHVLLVHNSRPNTSGAPRRIMIYSHHPTSVEMPFDIRNGPTRLRESPYEREYLRLKLRDEFEDLFQAPR